MKKYELTKISKRVYGVKVYRIKAIRSFSNVKKGKLGGWIEKESNLSHKGDCWIYDDACVHDNVKVYDNAKIYDNARVYGNVRVYGNASVYGNAQVDGNTRVCDNACVYGNSWIYGNVCVYGNAQVYDNTLIFGNARLYGNVEVCKKAKVYWDASVSYSKITRDIFNNNKPTKEYIEASLGIPFIGDKIFVYKRVDMFGNKIRSLYYKRFTYPKKGIVEVKDYEPNIMDS